MSISKRFQGTELPRLTSAITFFTANVPCVLDESKESCVLTLSKNCRNPMVSQESQLKRQDNTRANAGEEWLCYNMCNGGQQALDGTQVFQDEVKGS